MENRIGFPRIRQKRKEYFPNRREIKKPMGIGNEMANATEFMYLKKREGLYRLAYIAMCASYVVVPIVLIVGLMLLFPGARSTIIAVALIVGVPLVGCFAMPKIIYPATIRYVKIEYEYVIKGGNMTVNRVLDRKERREWMAPSQISKFEFIAPFEGAAKEAATAADIKHTYNAMPSKKVDPDDYCAVFTNEAGEKCAVMFRATNKALQIMKFLNRNTEVRPVKV